jgi:hypothetical protein
VQELLVGRLNDLRSLGRVARHTLQAASQPQAMTPEPRGGQHSQISIPTQGQHAVHHLHRLEVWGERHQQLS